MNKIFKKLLSACAVAAVFLSQLCAEDWEPTIFDNQKFKRADKAVKDYIEKNGTYLSGTDDFAFFYLKNATVSGSSVQTAESSKVFSIVYKDTAYYFETSDNYYSGQMDYSVISLSPPVIYLKFSSRIGLNTVVISYDGSDFLMNSINCLSEYYDDEKPGRYYALMSIPFKYSYLQGRKLLKQDTGSVSYVYSDDKDKMYESANHFRFWLLGIDGAKSVSEVYYHTIVTDDKLRLRTSNSKNAAVIAHLSKGTKVRIINIDTAITQMEGKDGFWVLVETNTGFIGWLWSNYLKGFDYETTRHFLDRDSIKTW